MDKKNGQPPKETDPNTHCHIIKNPRQLRAIAALADGGKSREALDKIIGASNSPAVVSKLREKGWDIPCESVNHVDRDGRKGWHGVYSLSCKDRVKLARMRLM